MKNKFTVCFFFFYKFYKLYLEVNSMPAGSKAVAITSDVNRLVVRHGRLVSGHKLINSAVVGNFVSNRSKVQFPSETHSFCFSADWLAVGTTGKAQREITYSLCKQGNQIKSAHDVYDFHQRTKESKQVKRVRGVL